MASESSRNPYERPKSVAAPGQAGVRKPGPLATVIIVIVSLMAAGCTFLCTCFGIGLISFDWLGALNEGLIILMAVLGGGFAAFVVGSFLSRSLSRFVTRHNFNSRPAPVDESPQDDHVS